MAARATWKGFLKISLVNIPIKVFPATESSGTISFNQLHGECQTRIQQKRWCPHCNREVPNSEIVKGYEFEKGRYVVLSEEDFDKVRPESTRVIDLVQFADESAIDPMYVDRTYYLAPDGGMAADAFAVMRDGHEGQGRRRQARALRPRIPRRRPAAASAASSMYTLHHAAEIRSIDAVEELNSVPAKVKPEEIKLARQVIETFEAPLNLADYKDEYREGLQRIIDAKIAGEEIVAPERRGAAEGRQPDGGAQEEPRRGERDRRRSPPKPPRPAAGRQAQRSRGSAPSSYAIQPFGGSTHVQADGVHAVCRRRPISLQPPQPMRQRRRLVGVLRRPQRRDQHERGRVVRFVHSHGAARSEAPRAASTNRPSCPG